MMASFVPKTHPLVPLLDQQALGPVNLSVSAYGHAQGISKDAREMIERTIKTSGVLVPPFGGQP